VRRINSLLILVLLTTSCSLVGQGEAAPTGEPTTTTTEANPETPAPTTTIAVPEPCMPTTVSAPDRLDSADPVALSIAISSSAFSCADRVALVRLGDEPAAVSAALELNGSGPVLIVDGPLEEPTRLELERLDPEEIVAYGLSPAALEGLGVPTSDGTLRVIPDRPLRRRDPAGGHLWLTTDTISAALTWTAAQAVGGSTIPAPSGIEMLESRAAIAAIQQAASITAIGSEFPGWELEVIRRAVELPGGGFTLFGDKRLVALYGNPTTPFLGVLGEQPPAEGLERLAQLSAGYDADGRKVVPTFEIIATVASARAGGDNDYSDEMSVESLRPWVEFAAANGMYVVLDLQPGRTDFLTQARYYEELLRLPHVGLALDPEWRLGPNQVHLRQIGTVDAAEVNRVSEWLAGIVAEEALPQKLFLVHQFRFSMITNRDLIETPPELAVVIQMDGQGPLPTKYETYRAITTGTEAVTWRWGWKNFFDEDTPMATAEQVLAVDPPVVFVSFQ
jgi:hypothetical protein